MRKISKLLTTGLLSLLAGGQVSAAIPSNMSVTPSNNSTVQSITEIRVTYNGYYDLEASKSTPFTIGDKSYSYNNGDYTYSWDFQGNDTYVIKLAEPYTTEGTVQISFPKGFFFYDNGYSYIECDAISWSVTIEGGGGTDPDPDPEIPATAIPSGYTVTPTPDSTVESISEITITSRSDENFTVYPKAKFKIDGVELELNTDFTTTVSGAFNDLLTIKLNTPITEEGTHVIDIPAGFFWYEVGWYNEEDSDPFVWSVTIEHNGGGDTPDPDTPEIPESYVPYYFTVTPGDEATVEELKVIRVDYYNSSPWEEFYANTSVTFTIDGKPYTRNDYSGKYDGDYSYVITLNDAITTPGVHTISIPEGYFTSEIVSEQDLQRILWSVIIPDNGSNNPDTPEVPEANIPSYFTVTPENGATVSSLSTISVEYHPSSMWDELIARFMTRTFTIDGNTYGKDDITTSWSNDEFTFIVTLNEPITTEGVHTISFPEGYFYIDGFPERDLDAVSWSVIVSNNGGGTPEPTGPEFTITPADGSTVEGLYTIVVTSDDVNYFSPNSRVKLQINGSDIETTASVSGTESNILTYTLTSPIETAGTYNVTIPAGAFSYYDANDEQQTSEAFSFTVNVTAPKGEFTPIENVGVIIEPEQGEYPSLTEFHLIFTGSHYFPDLNSFYPIYLKNEETGENVAQLSGVEGSAYTDIFLVLPEPVTAEGHYILDIPEGAIYDYDDYDMPAMQFRYWVDGSGTVEVPQETVYADPENGSTVAALSEVVLTFPGMSEVFASGPQKKDIKVTCDGEEVETEVSFNFDSSIDVSQIIMNFSPALTDEGNYQIYVPSYVLSLGITQFDTRWNNEFTLSYTVAPEMEILSISPADGSELEELSNIKITLASASILQDVEGISTVIGSYENGVPSGEAGPENSWTGNAVSALQYILTPVDANGDAIEIEAPEGQTLFVLLPAGLFTLESDDSAESEAITLAYVGKFTTGIDSIVNDEDAEIYTLDGIRVNDMKPGNIYVIRKGNKMIKSIGK